MPRFKQPMLHSAKLTMFLALVVHANAKTLVYPSWTESSGRMDPAIVAELTGVFGLMSPAMWQKEYEMSPPGESDEYPYESFFHDGEFGLTLDGETHQLALSDIKTEHCYYFKPDEFENGIGFCVLEGHNGVFYLYSENVGD